MKKIFKSAEWGQKRSDFVVVVVIWAICGSDYRKNIKAMLRSELEINLIVFCISVLEK